MSTYNALYYDTTTKEVVYGPAPNPLPNGAEYSDYLFWDNNTSQWTAGSSTVHLGANAGQTQQGTSAIAIGNEAGQNNQSVQSIAVGRQCAQFNQGVDAIAIGAYAGFTGQKWSTIAIGNTAGANDQGENAVAIGRIAGLVSQGIAAVAIGESAGQTNQGTSSVAIGYQAGQTNQSSGSMVAYAFVATVARNASNVATIVCTGSHNLLTGDVVSIVVTSNTSFDATNVTITVTDPLTFTYANTGTPLATTNDGGTVAGPGRYAVAMGFSSGAQEQGHGSVAIGYRAGSNYQSGFTVLASTIQSVRRDVVDVATIITNYRHNLVSGQKIRVVLTSPALSDFSAYNTTCTVVGPFTITYPNTGPIVGTTDATGQIFMRSIHAVAIGTNAGSSNQGGNGVAIGRNAANFDQNANAIAIGVNAARTGQGASSVAIGVAAGQTNQGITAVSIGANAGALNQAANAIAIGSGAGQANQQVNTVAIGVNAGNGTQNNYAVAVGGTAGQANQGVSAVAIGYAAGTNAQPNQTIIINALESPFNATTAGACYIRPVREVVSGTSSFSDFSLFQSGVDEIYRKRTFHFVVLIPGTPLGVQNDRFFVVNYPGNITLPTVPLLFGCITDQINGAGAQQLLVSFYNRGLANFQLVIRNVGNSTALNGFGAFVSVYGICV